MTNWSLNIFRQINPLSGINTVSFQKIQINKIDTANECFSVVEASVGIFTDLSISKREKDFDCVDVGHLLSKGLGIKHNGV